MATSFPLLKFSSEHANAKQNAMKIAKNQLEIAKKLNA